MHPSVRAQASPQVPHCPAHSPSPFAHPCCSAHPPLMCTLPPPCLCAAWVLFTQFAHRGDGEHGGGWHIAGGRGGEGMPVPLVCMWGDGGRWWGVAWGAEGEHAGARSLHVGGEQGWQGRWGEPGGWRWGEPQGWGGGGVLAPLARAWGRRGRWRRVAWGAEGEHARAWGLRVGEEGRWRGRWGEPGV
jgi:hypothetical protein